MNTRAVADAIAARFVGVSATVGAATETLTTENCSALLPNQIATGPWLTVFPPAGVLDVTTSRMRQDDLDFPVRLLRDPSDVPTRTAWLYAWIDALRDRVEMNVDLDLPTYVAYAQPVALQAELDGFEYAKVPMDMVELTVRVRLEEHVATVAV